MDYDPADRIPNVRHTTAAWIACVLVAIGALGLPVLRDHITPAEAGATVGTAQSS